MATVSRRLTASILSMSLLTVMAGAAVAPALGAIKAHFSDSSQLMLQFIVSMPALFIIVANIAFPYVCNLMKTRTLALTGLVMYVAFGILPFFTGNLALILIFRALLGISVGLIMPLSTGLIAYYYSREEQSELMGLSGAMNQMGGVIATLVAGMLAEISWNAAFLVYLLGLIAVVLVARSLPNVSLAKEHDSAAPSTLSRIVRYKKELFGMFMLMALFFVYPSNFAIVSSKTTSLSSAQITLIMVGLDVVAFFIGIFFGRMMRRFGRNLGYTLPILFGAAYLILALSGNIAMILLACVLIGTASGLGVPFYNSVAAMEAGQNAATTVMPLLSACLYAGQFLSPLLISELGSAAFGSVPTAPYRMAVVFVLIFLAAQLITWLLRAKRSQES